MPAMLNKAGIISSPSVCVCLPVQKITKTTDHKLT